MGGVAFAAPVQDFLRQHQYAQALKAVGGNQAGGGQSTQRFLKLSFQQAGLSG